MTRTLFKAMIVAALALSACTAQGSGLALPLEDAALRATPLHFGLYVTPDPDQNPIDPPERFIGYHVATDIEIDPSEQDRDVIVYAICSGQVTYSGYADGYGGLLVHRCKINGEDATVIYGHIKLADLPEEGETVQKGQKISVLADAKSYESDGNRKHLHLGIHKGKKMDIRGYVQTKEEIDQFLDPQSVLPL